MDCGYFESTNNSLFNDLSLFSRDYEYIHFWVSSIYFKVILIELCTNRYHNDFENSIVKNI